MKYNLWDLPRLTPEQKVSSFAEVSEMMNPGGVKANGYPFILATGVFDIVHPGHLNFFERAARWGSVVVGIESDASVRANKGQTRPINTIDERMLVVASLQSVRLVCELPGTPLYDDPSSFDTYVDRLKSLNPLFVAVPEGDPNFAIKRHQAFASEVIPTDIPGRLPSSTTLMLQKVGFQE